MFKPWNLKNIMYEEEFFKYAEMAGVKDEIIEQRESIPQEVVDKILQGVDSVKQFCNLEASKAEEYHKKINAPKPKIRIQTTSSKLKEDERKYKMLTKERQLVVDKINELERQRKFDVDVENDPPFNHLMPGDVDYLRKKLSSKIKTWWANHSSYRYFKRLIKE